MHQSETEDSREKERSLLLSFSLLSRVDDIRETKSQLNERFEDHRRSILNHQQHSDPTPVSLHFNQAGHSMNDVDLIPLELIRSNRDAVRKAREAHVIRKGNTLSPPGINRRDEAHRYMIPPSSYTNNNLLFFNVTFSNSYL